MPPDDNTDLPKAIPELPDIKKPEGKSKQLDTRQTLGSEAFLPPGPLAMLAIAAMGQLPANKLTDTEVKTMLGANDSRYHNLESSRQNNTPDWNSTTSKEKNSLWNAEYAGLLQVAQNGWRPGGAQTVDDRAVDVFGKTSPALAARFLALRTLNKKDIAVASERVGIKLSDEDKTLLKSPGEEGYNAVATRRFDLLRTLEAQYLQFLKDPNWKPGKIDDPALFAKLAKSIQENPSTVAITKPAEAADPAAGKEKAKTKTETAETKAETAETKAGAAATKTESAATKTGAATKAAEVHVAKAAGSGGSDEISKKTQAQIAQDLKDKVTPPAGTAKELVAARQPLIDKLVEFGKGMDPAVTEKLRKLVREVNSSRMDSETLVKELSNQFGLTKSEEPDEAFTKLIASLKTHIGPGTNNDDLRTALDALAKAGPVDKVLAENLQKLNDSFGTTQTGAPEASRSK